MMSKRSDKLSELEELADRVRDDIIACGLPDPG
jgi:hypothetical protein